MATADSDTNSFESSGPGPAGGFPHAVLGAPSRRRRSSRLRGVVGMPLPPSPAGERRLDSPEVLGTHLANAASAFVAGRLLRTVACPLAEMTTRRQSPP